MDSDSGRSEMPQQSGRCTPFPHLVDHRGDVTVSYRWISASIQQEDCAGYDSIDQKVCLNPTRASSWELPSEGPAEPRISASSSTVPVDPPVTCW
jgi:hypothetical protein